MLGFEAKTHPFDSRVPFEILDDAANATIDYRQLLTDHGLTFADIRWELRCPDPRIQDAHDCWHTHIQNVISALTESQGHTAGFTQAFDLVQATVKICRLTIEDPRGTPHTCTKRAGSWHIHRSTQKAWIFYPFNRIYVRNLKEK